MIAEKRAIPFVFAPGCEQQLVCEKGDYRDLMGVLEDIEMPGVRFAPVFVQPDWKNDTPKHWVEAMCATASDAAERHGVLQVMLGGFSFGAVMALRSAVLLRKDRMAPSPRGVLAASLAPYDRETFPVLMQLEPDAPNNLTEETVIQLRTEPIPTPDCNTQLYVGTEEEPYMHIQAGMTVQRLPAAQLIMVPEASHNVLDPAYMEAIGMHAGNLALGSEAFIQQASAAYSYPLESYR